MLVDSHHFRNIWSSLKTWKTALALCLCPQVKIAILNHSWNLKFKFESSESESRELDLLFCECHHPSFENREPPHSLTANGPGQYLSLPDGNGPGQYLSHQSVLSHSSSAYPYPFRSPKGITKTTLRSEIGVEFVKMWAFLLIKSVEIPSTKPFT